MNHVDLHAHSSYSVLDGFPDPEEMAEKAAALGRTAMALTDHGSVSGHVLFEKAAKKAGIKPIYGLEAYAVSDATARSKEFQRKNHITLLAKNLTGYRNLLKLVTRSYEEGFYYRPTIDARMLLEQKEGLIVLSGCESSSFMRHIAEGQVETARDQAYTFQHHLGEDFYIELQHYPHLQLKTMTAEHIARKLDIKIALTCDCHYLEAEDWRYQQFLWSVRDGKLVDDEMNKMEYAQMWESQELLKFCQAVNSSTDWPTAMDATAEIASKIESFDIPKAPRVTFPGIDDKILFMRKLCKDRLFDEGLIDPIYNERLDTELDLIKLKGFEDYFLVVWDMVTWAKRHGLFVGPARGSAAGSLVCYGLHITEVDPIRYDLMFERFIDITRVDLPDIDLDFEDERRQEVLDYMSERWGREHVAFISTFARFGGRGVLDDVARSYKIPRSEIEVIKRHLVERSSGDARAELTLQDTIEEFPEARAVYERYPALQVAAKVQGKVRHMGKHAAGLVVTSEPVEEYMAVYKNGEERLVAVDWRDSMYLNMMKIDVLGLKELTIIRLICEAVGLTLQELYKVPVDDQETFDAFNRQDFWGVFQYAGLATKGVAGRILFTDIDQVADVNALSRPGPLHAGATEAYTKGRSSGEYKPILPQEIVQPVIQPTYGQIVYQEQVMKILRDVGGLDWEDVYAIRQIISKSKGEEAFDNYRPKWDAGCGRSGIGLQDSAQIWETIKHYGRHGFNKAHAVSYGIVAYLSMYLKVHYPTEFHWAQLVKTEGIEHDTRCLREAIRKGIVFRSFSVAEAHESWVINGDGSISPGLSLVVGLGPKSIAELAAKGPFTSIEDIQQKCEKRIVNKAKIEALRQYEGKTVAEIYGLDVWKQYDTPTRTNIEDVNRQHQGDFEIIGRVSRINKKNRIEEYKQKGQDISKINQTQPQDYAILIVEDETDSCMAYINPQQYIDWSEPLWASPGKMVMVRGPKMPGVQLISAKEFKLLEGMEDERSETPGVYDPLSAGSV